MVIIVMRRDKSSPGSGKVYDEIKLQCIRPLILRDGVWSVSRSGENRPACFSVPGESLRSNRACCPADLIVSHAVIYHEPLSRVSRRLHERGVTDAISFFSRILVKYAAGGVFLPGSREHWIGVAAEFEETETVISVVGAGGRVDYESLVVGWICELLGTFVAAETDVDCTVVRGFLPGLIGFADYGARRERRGHGPGI